jgi:hypothetical protein
MADSFHQAYAQLTDFVAKHNEIEIGVSVISIPENVRTDFYRLFNEARRTFVNEKFPAHLARAKTLQDKYNKAAEDAAGWLSLEEPPAVNALQRFLRDPKDCLARELFDPLFDLLKGRGSVDDFERRASTGIKELFPIVFRGGYEKWVVLSLLNLLDVEKAFRVNVRNLSPGERTKPAAQAPMEEVPFPQESTSFFFSQPRNTVFAVPDYIVRSSRLNRFVGIRSECREGCYNALNAAQERAWHPLDIGLLRLLGSGLTLVYLAERADSIALVADVARFCGPDLVFWCLDTQVLNQKEALAHVMRAHTRLKPPRGSYIIANDEWAESFEPAEADPQAQLAEQTSGIHVLTVGYDEARLVPVAEALFNAAGPAKTT